MQPRFEANRRLVGLERYFQRHDAVEPRAVPGTRRRGSLITRSLRATIYQPKCWRRACVANLGARHALRFGPLSSGARRQSTSTRKAGKRGPIIHGVSSLPGRGRTPCASPRLPASFRRRSSPCNDDSFSNLFFQPDIFIIIFTSVRHGAWPTDTRDCCPAALSKHPFSALARLFLHIVPFRPPAP
jgi:hypothetical protein